MPIDDDFELDPDALEVHIDDAGNVYMEQEIEQAVSCRWCECNKSTTDMAIYSWKVAFGKFTGVCKDCIDDPAKELAYLQK